MTARPPTEKLGLAVRKNVRDEFDSKKPELEERLSKLLDVPWTIEVNPNAIHAYSDGDSYSGERLGACLYNYFDSAISGLKYFLESEGHGAEGVKEINELASKHILTLGPDLKKSVSYCGTEIDDGYLRIIFKEGNLGVNIGDSFAELEKTLSEASAAAAPGSMTYTARHSVKTYWDPKVEEIQQKIGEQLHNADIKLTPNFEASFLALKASKDADKDFERTLGQYITSYFESLASSLEYNKFKDDDMLYEGFAEAVPKGEVAFRVVEKLTGSSSYNQILVEDGVFVMQTVPQNFGTNTGDIASRIVDIL